MAGVNAFDAAGWDQRDDLSPVNKLSYYLTGNPFLMNAFAAGPRRPMHISPQARASGNIEDRRGHPMTPQQVQAMQEALDRQVRYARWQNDEYARVVQQAYPENPADRAEAGAINHHVDQLNPQRQAVPAWAPQQPPNLYPQAPAQPYTPPMRFAR